MRSTPRSPSGLVAFLVPAVGLAIALGSGAVGGGCSHAESGALPVARDASPNDAAAPVWDCGDADFSGSPLGVRCGALVDEGGRTVLLHGVNARVNGVFDVTFSDGRAPLEPIPDFDASDAAAIRAIGFNALRLPINWSALEPTETGGFDEAYLDRVASVSDLCRASGLYVLLDVHQDAYSKEIGEDGAPLWAIVPPPTSLLGGPLTDLYVRRLSTQVGSAFTTFFGDSEGGVRLRQRFTSMLAHVAARFAEDPSVVGIELLNEPIASDIVLQNEWRPMIAAVRAAAPKKLVLFEPSATRNQTDRAAVGAGSFGRGTAYAPHVYTLAFNGSDEQRAHITKDVLLPSYVNAREEADSFLAPLVITELGWDPHAGNFADYMRWQAELGDDFLASNFLWVWAENSQGSWGFFDYDAQTGARTLRQDAVRAVSRVRLEAAPGRLTSVGYDASAKRFEAHFDGNSADDRAVVTTGGVLTSFVAACDGQAIDPDGDRAARELVFHCGGVARASAAAGADPLNGSEGGVAGHVLTVTGL